MPHYKLIPASTPVIDGTALWHIILASIAAGAGLAIAFGLILYGWEMFEESKNEGAKAGGVLLGLLAAAFCVGAVGIGVYVMTHPPKSKPLKVEATSLVSGIHRPAA